MLTKTTCTTILILLLAVNIYFRSWLCCALSALFVVLTIGLVVGRVINNIVTKFGRSPKPQKTQLFQYEQLQQFKTEVLGDCDDDEDSDTDSSDDDE